MLTTEIAAGIVPAASFEKRTIIVKIKILRTTVCGGKPVEKGKVIDASDKDANYLIGIGKAESAEKSKDDKKSDKE